jgi:hypothetical protein
MAGYDIRCVKSLGYVSTVIAIFEVIYVGKLFLLPSGVVESYSRLIILHYLIFWCLISRKAKQNFKDTWHGCYYAVHVQVS